MAWAEREFGASRHRVQRGVTGCFNGGQFALDMGLRHLDLFGHVFAFSKAGVPRFRLPDAMPEVSSAFHLAAGEWEPFDRGTLAVVDELKKHNAQHTFVSRVAGHDSTMWGEELAAANDLLGDGQQSNYRRGHFSARASDSIAVARRTPRATGRIPASRSAHMGTVAARPICRSRLDYPGRQPVKCAA